MEVKVENTLKIIDEDGDTFAKRAEMYYRKRPELVNFVEDFFRSYRALAERYDHLSRDLQNANRTIATVFPERVQYAIDDEENVNDQISTSINDLNNSSDSKRNIPEVPKMMKNFKSPSMLLSRKGYLKRIASTSKAISTPKSGLTKDEALKEIDKLQKAMLAMQTEKEFVRSVYEHGYEKYWDIEHQVTEMHKKVSSLQDEFGIGTVFDDNEARTLMAATALKSCQETLFKLQEEHEISSEDAKHEHYRIKDIIAKFKELELEYVPDSKVLSGEPFRSTSESKILEEDIDNIALKKKELEKIRSKIRENLEFTCKSLTISEFAERIDELVSLVVALETASVSLTALFTRLRSEVDDLQDRIRSLEANKETLKESSDYMNKQLEEFKEKMYMVKSLNKDVEDKTSNLQTQFTEAQGNIDHLCGKLQDVTVDEEVENIVLFKNVRAVVDDKLEDELGENYEEPMQEEKEEKQDLSETVGSNLDMTPPEWDLEKEEGGPPNWRQLFHKGLEDREKVLLEEYTSVLQDYKEVKKKLNEVENKNKDNIFDLAVQIRDLKQDIAVKDGEIKLLQQKINYPQPNLDESPYPCSTEYKYATQENITQASTPAYSDMIVQTGNLDQESISELGKKKKMVVRSHSIILTFEDKFRWDIDELLEENMEFWLRFSTSIHQIQKFQNSIGDLQSELTKVKDKKTNEEGSSKLSLQSDIRPIYRHMREIQTELDLWLEHNSILKDELQNRFSSLCNMQEEIFKMSSSRKGELSEYQAAKFQGEVRNMKQENKKVTEELQVGANRVRRLKADLEKTLLKLDDEFGIFASNNNSTTRNAASRIRIPLRSFLFGVKLKKHKRSFFSCTNPTL